MKFFVYIISLMMSFIHIFAGIIFVFYLLGVGEVHGIFAEMFLFPIAMFAGTIFIGGGMISGLFAKFAYDLDVDYRGNGRKKYFIFVFLSFVINIFLCVLLCKI